VDGHRPSRGSSAWRPCIYGENRIELTKRAGQRRGWMTGVFDLYGKQVKKRYKTFLATWRSAGSLRGGYSLGLLTQPQRLRDLVESN
jgi:hypothetical protein